MNTDNDTYQSAEKEGTDAQVAAFEANLAAQKKAEQAAQESSCTANTDPAEPTTETKESEESPQSAEPAEANEPVASEKAEDTLSPDTAEERDTAPTEPQDKPSPELIDPALNNCTAEIKQLTEKFAVLEHLIAGMSEYKSSCEKLLTELERQEAAAQSTAVSMEEFMKKLTAAADSASAIQQEINRTAHWLENTNKWYTDVVKAFPIQAEKTYKEIEIRHRKNYQMVLMKLADAMEKKIIKPPKPFNFRIIFGGMIVQTILLYLLL